MLYVVDSIYEYMFLTAAGCNRRGFYTHTHTHPKNLDPKSANLVENANLVQSLANSALSLLSQTFSTFCILSHTFSALGTLSQLLGHFLKICVSAIMRKIDFHHLQEKYSNSCHLT